MEEIEYLKSNSYIGIRKREEVISYSESAMTHVNKMLRGLLHQLAAMVKAGENNDNNVGS